METLVVARPPKPSTEPSDDEILLVFPKFFPKKSGNALPAIVVFSTQGCFVPYIRLYALHDPCLSHSVSHTADSAICH
eukprot:326742-Rhodomonas_salina.1